MGGTYQVPVVWLGREPWSMDSPNPISNPWAGPILHFTSQQLCWTWIASKFRKRASETSVQSRKSLRIIYAPEHQPKHKHQNSFRMPAKNILIFGTCDLKIAGIIINNPRISVRLQNFRTFLKLNPRISVYIFRGSINNNKI